MHRLMLTSNAYRMSSRAKPQAAELGTKLDVANDLFWRFEEPFHYQRALAAYAPPTYRPEDGPEATRVDDVVGRRGDVVVDLLATGGRAQAATSETFSCHCRCHRVRL